MFELIFSQLFFFVSNVDTFLHVLMLSFYFLNIFYSYLGNTKLSHLKKIILLAFWSLILSMPAVSLAQTITATGTVTNIHCHGDSTGSIAYQINGGVGAVNYVWNTGDSGVWVGVRHSAALWGVIGVGHNSDVGGAVVDFSALKVMGFRSPRSSLSE